MLEHSQEKYVDPDDMEFKDPMSHVPKNIGNAAGIRHALQNCLWTQGRPVAQKTTLEGQDTHVSSKPTSTRTRIRDHEDLIAEKGFDSLSHYTLVHKPMQKNRQ